MELLISHDPPGQIDRPNDQKLRKNIAINVKSFVSRRGTIFSGRIGAEHLKNGQLRPTSTCRINFKFKTRHSIYANYTIS